MKRIFSAMAFFLFGLIVCYGQNAPTLHNEEIEKSIKYQDGNEYQKDLLLYIDMLVNTHPYYADAKHRSKLEKRTQKMYRECGELSDVGSFKVYLAEVAASLHDGHTAISYWNTLDRIFPFRLVIDGKAPAIIDATSEEHKVLLGKEVAKINGEPLKQILKKARAFVSADNEINFENLVKEYMMFTEFWALMGMSDEAIHLTFTDGSSTNLSAINKREFKVAQLQKNTKGRVTAQRRALFDYTIYENESICYLQFNQFADRLTHPQYTQLARFDEFIRNMMTEIKKKEIQTLVIDLQYNGGGNSQLGDVLLSWLYPHKETKRYSVDIRMSELLCTQYPYYRELTVNKGFLEMGCLYNHKGFDQSKDYEIDYNAAQDSTKHVYNFDKEQIFNGNIIFIQGKKTFSSATLLLTMARDNNIGVIVGEPSGGKPSSYGDILYCKLPNTNTLATVSHKHFIRPNKALSDREYIIPDMAIELNDPDRDLVWEWILEHYTRKTD